MCLSFGCGRHAKYTRTRRRPRRRGPCPRCSGGKFLGFQKQNLKRDKHINPVSTFESRQAQHGRLIQHGLNIHVVCLLPAPPGTTWYRSVSCTASRTSNERSAPPPTCKAEASNNSIWLYDQIIQYGYMTIVMSTIW